MVKPPGNPVMKAVRAKARTAPEGVLRVGAVLERAEVVDARAAGCGGRGGEAQSGKNTHVKLASGNQAS